MLPVTDCYTNFTLTVGHGGDTTLASVGVSQGELAVGEAQPGNKCHACSHGTRLRTIKNIATRFRHITRAWPKDIYRSLRLSLSWLALR
jgi:hypothetical protein